MQWNRLSIWSQEADEVGVETGHVTHVVEAVADLGKKNIKFYIQRLGFEKLPLDRLTCIRNNISKKM